MAPSQFFSFKNDYHLFEAGMLVEAVDLIEPHLICVAIIKRVVGRLLLVHFIGWDDSYDQWCDCDSPSIFPVGYCDLVQWRLQGPPSKNGISAERKRKTTLRKSMLL